MNNKFCKACGQANLPNAELCTKCGNALSRSEDHQAVQNTTTQKPKKKSKKFFWILGILGVFLIFSFVGVSITAVAAYLYFASPSSVAREYPPPTRGDEYPSGDQANNGDEYPSGDIKFPSNDGDVGSQGDLNKKASNITDAKLTAYFKSKKSKVGGFSLVVVTPTYDKTALSKRIAGVRASYVKGSKSLTHNFAAYGSKSALISDFDDYQRNASNTSTKVVKTTATSIVYTKAGLYYLAFRNPDGGFHEISSRNFKDILNYHNDYFDVK